MAQKIDEELFDEIRHLPTFKPGCDLEAFAITTDDPVVLIDKLVKNEFVAKAEICRWWSTRINLAYVDPAATLVDEEAIACIPKEIALKLNILPIYLVDETLTILAAYPEDEVLVDRLTKISMREVSLVFALPSDITPLVHLHYTSSKSVEVSMKKVAEYASLAKASGFSTDGKTDEGIIDSEHVTNFVEMILYFAIKKESSDIHIEPDEESSILRFRIDGVLRTVLEMPKKLHLSIVSRIKVLCNLDITESRLPADGRFDFDVGGKKVFVRVSTIPTQYGQKVVMRVLDRGISTDVLKLNQMLISQTIYEPFKRIMQSPSGIIFLTGPTGSGKTSTLYAALAEINNPGINISTVEDPIEIQMEGVNQSQVNHDIGLDFSLMLRSLLRQDPDVILIGEIRDLETAKIATQAALTGHLVFSTLHTNSAPETIIRLRDMGVEQFMIAPSVLASMSQRLAARICPHCKEAYTPSRETIDRLFEYEEASIPEVVFYRGKGCERCNNLGYKGRVAFHELFVINKAVREVISDNGGLGAIISEAEKIGYRPLRYDGLKKVLLGLTTVEEVISKTQVELESL